MVSRQQILIPHLLENIRELEQQNAELLEALKVLYSMVDEQYGNGIANGYWPTVAPRLEQAQQAIAKAEGGE